MQPDFKSKFYNLEGVTLKDRKKNLYTLLKSTSANISDEELKIEPRNFLEGLYNIEVLIYFRKALPLWDILKTGNEIFGSKILKQKWFIHEIFSNINEEQLVNQILPSFSYSLRMKVLKKVSKVVEESTMDKIFDLTLERYGQFIAIQFLSCCSKEKVEKFLQNNELKLLSGQVKALFDKDPQLLVTYLREYKKNNDGSNYDDAKLYSYITKRDLKFALQLRSEFQVIIKLGKRNTKYFIQTHEKEIRENFNCNLSYLNQSVLVRNMKGFQQILNQLFPKGINNFVRFYPFEINQLLKSYPHCRRWKVFCHSFSDLYHKEPTEYLLHLPEQLIHYAPVPIVQQWAQVQYEEKDVVKFLKYGDPIMVFSIIKEKMNFTSKMNDRMELLQVMVENCMLQKDFKTLEEVLAYICLRHRNEDIGVQGAILQTINYNEQNVFKSLNDNHWKCINEIIDTYKSKKVVYSGFASTSFIYDLLRKHLEYLYENNKRNEEHLVNFIKEIIGFNRPFGIKSDNDLINRNVFEDISKLLPTIEVSNKESHILDLFKEIVSFNKWSKHVLNVYDYPVFTELLGAMFLNKESIRLGDLELVQYILEYNDGISSKLITLPADDEFLVFIKRSFELHSSWNPVYEYLTEIVKKCNRTPLQNKLLDFYFSEQVYVKHGYHRRSEAKSALKCFLVNEPQVVVKYYDVLLQLPGNLLEVIQLIRKYTHLQLDTRLIEAFKISQDKESFLTRLKALASLMPVEDFVRYMAQYEPTTKKADLSTDEQREIYKIQCDIGRTLKLVTEPLKILATVQKFCVGDYLHSSLCSLYSIVYRIPEKDAETCILWLLKQAVSVRKHGLSLTCEVLPISKVKDFFTKTAVSEKNVSVKKNWFSSILKYFLKNPSEIFFNFVILNLNFISEKDREIFDLISRDVDISKNYLPLYLERVWHYFEAHAKNQVKVDKYLSNLLSQMHLNVIMGLRQDFCKHIIDNYFLSDNPFSESVDSFVKHYLMIYVEEGTFEYVFNALKEYKHKYSVLNKRDKINRLFEFFINVYNSMDEIANFQFILLFKQHWEQLFTHIESFREYLLLKFIVLYKEDKSVSAEQFAKKVSDLMEELENSYQFTLTHIIVNVVDTFFSSIHKTEMHDLFFYHLVAHKRNIIDCLITLLHFQSRSISSENKIIADTLNILEQVENPAIQIEYKDLMRHNQRRCSYNIGKKLFYC